MGISWCPRRRGSIALFFIVICSLWWRVQSQASSCTVGCGSNSDCLNGICACQTDYVSPSGSNADCISLSAPNPQCTQYDTQCTYCGSFSQGPCVRCVDDLFLSGESCVTFCERGFQISVLPNTQISARVCMTTGCTVGCGSNSDCLNGICACQTDYVSPSGSNADCISLSAPNPQCTQYDTQCTYCGSFSQGPCVRCVDDRFLSGESCVTICEAGFQITFLPNTQISARVCMTTDNTGLPEWAVIVIAVVAVIIFVLIVVAVVGFALTILTRSSHGQFDVEDADLRESTGGTLRTKRSNSFSFERKQEKSKAVTHHNPNYIDEIEGDDETVFYHKLKYLRTQAEVFLKMLNDMRRRLKEIPVDSAAAQQYRNVMQDVTRLLYLLNKKPSAVEMPPDGLQLLVWSEQILERYLSSQGVTLTRSSNRLSILGPQDETQF